MSTVLHPSGPEAPQTYWLRRAVVIAAAVIVVAVVIALIVNGSSTGSAVQQQPPVTGPTGVAATTPTPFAQSSSVPAASASASAAGTPSAGDPSATSSASTVAKSKASTTATASPKAKKSGPTACDAAQLRATLTGKQRLKPKQPNTFTLSLINGSGQTCLATVSDANFELKIYSGTDRIWSTDDCSTAMTRRTVTLKAEQAMEWKVSWNGRRSRADCKNRPEIPRTGTYFATAQLDGAKPVQLRMVLTG